MRKICTILLFLSILLPAPAQTARLFSPENGLVSSQVNRVSQDRGDIVWLCTEGGLIRFDGTRFETFRHDRADSKSIPADSVHDLCEDRTGTSWVGTASGLCIFNPDDGSFLPFDLQDARLPSSNQYVSSLLEVPGRVSGSKLFIGTGGYGIYVVECGSRKLLDADRERIYTHLTSEYIREIFLDSDRRLWVAQEGDSGLVILEADSLEPAAVSWSPDLAATAAEDSPFSPLTSTPAGTLRI